jgi:predicted O-methyltransferase YrrM
VVPRPIAVSGAGTFVNRPSLNLLSPSLASPRTGPVFAIAQSVLASHREYHSFLGGGSRRAFGVFLDSIAPELIAAGLPPDDVQFAKRYPQSQTAFVGDELRRLMGIGILPQSDYDKAGYERIAAQIQDDYDHGPFRTYIYPEEARLLYAVADILRPRSTIFLGSYYGYWARAPLSVIARHGGHAVLVDPDPKAQNLARHNLKSAGLLDAVELAVTTGQDYLQQTPDRYDLVVLDAEMPRDFPDPQQRGKAIYGPLLHHALARMTPDATLVCHNYLFENVAGCRFFDRVIERNRDEMGVFLDIAAREFAGLCECTSTEGVGVGKRRSAGQRAQPAANGRSYDS